MVYVVGPRIKATLIFHKNDGIHMRALYVCTYLEESKPLVLGFDAIYIFIRIR